jgi:hypothetical protein
LLFFHKEFLEYENSTSFQTIRYFTDAEEKKTGWAEYSGYSSFNVLKEFEICHCM